MPHYWLTIAVETEDDDTARKIAVGCADAWHGRVVQVDYEPPQGALIVGDAHEDATTDV